MLVRKLSDLVPMALFAIPATFVPLHLTQAEGDVGIDPNFAWLVFDRAVLHHAEVSGRAHAVREMLVLDSAADTAHRSGPSGTMDGPERDALGALFKQIRKAGGATDETYRQLCARLETVLETAV